jgi:Ser/Thr protein kinase RdoA (MazF antagonist)
MGIDSRFWGPIDDDEAAAVLRAYPALGGPVSVVARHRRWLFAVARCSVAGREVILKRQPRMRREPAQARWQHALANHLADRGVPAARVLAREDGDTHSELGGLWYEVVEPAAGDDVYDDTDTWEPFRSVAHVRAAGDMLARLHDAGASFAPLRAQPPAGFVVQLGRLDSPVAAVADAASARPAVAAYLGDRDWRDAIREAYEEPFARLEPLARDLPVRPLHGDWQTNNLFFLGDELTGIIDFHQADCSARILDLAVAVERNCFFWNRIAAGDDAAHDLGHAAEMLRAYHRRSPLTAAERAAFPDVLATCQLEYGLSFLDYYWGVESDREKADWAWETFVLGHASWWQGRAGRAARARLETIVDAL